jgi:hypothetical protein
MPDRHPDGVFAQAQHGNADSRLVPKLFFQSHFSKAIGNSASGSRAIPRTTRRGDVHRDWVSMKAPVVIVTAALTLAILLAASFLIATGTRGENAFRPPADAARWHAPASPAAK